jgi:hypothetical protein
MQNNRNTKKLTLSATTIRNLGHADLSLVAGGQIATRQGCTKKNSECNACPELE